MESASPFADYYFSITADNLTEFHTDRVVSNAQNVINLLAGHTTVCLFYHSREGIARMRTLVPGELTSLTSALQLHHSSPVTISFCQIAIGSSLGFGKSSLRSNRKSSVVDYLAK